MSVVEDGRSTTESPLVRVAELEGRGRALIASQPLKGGQIVLKDSPILLYSALPLKQALSPPPPEQLTSSSNYYYYCSNCFRSNCGNSMISCPSCYALFFCSPNCRSIALSSFHSPWVCQALSRLRDCPSNLLSLLHHHERQVQAQFLVAAYNLAVVSPSDFGTLLSLQGKDQDQDDDAIFLHSLISSLCPPPPLQNCAFSLELTAALLAKDKLNAFGLMEPVFSFSGKEGEEKGERTRSISRSVRAYGIYPKASFFNHDCLPNACRFEYLDNNDSNNNTDMIVRAIHDIPQGREICLSYFPVNLNYSERQHRLREDYGFTCECDRCKVEANWSQEEDSEIEEAMDEDMEEEEEECEGMEDGEINRRGNDNDDDFPHAYFFLRYMCNKENCWGTLAPLPSSDSTPPSSVMECNVCGNLKKDEDDALG